MEDQTQQNPKVVVDAIIGSPPSTRLKELTIYRYAWLERIGSPFVRTGQKFDMENLVPSLFVMMAEISELKSMNGKSHEEIVEEALEWIDSRCSLHELPTLIDDLTRAFREVGKAAPKGGGSEKNAEAGQTGLQTAGCSTQPISSAPSSTGS